MASLEGARSPGHLDFEILEDNHHDTDQNSTAARKTLETDTSILAELAINTLYETPRGTPGSSTFAPEKPLRQTPLKENVKEKIKDKRHEQHPQHLKQPSSTSPLANSKDGEGLATGGILARQNMLRRLADAQLTKSCLNRPSAKPSTPTSSRKKLAPNKRRAAVKAPGRSVRMDPHFADPPGFSHEVRKA